MGLTGGGLGRRGMLGLVMGEVRLVEPAGWIEWVWRIKGLMVVVTMVEMTLSSADCGFVWKERQGLPVQGASHLAAREARNCPA